jgi:A/G-specific adenine glycosylase
MAPSAKATSFHTQIPGRVRARFHGALLEWYRANRRDLPWRRRQEDVYAVWVSEVMLQQTQVATAAPYFERWMERFPTIAALAEADEQEALRYWSGLGYYARARNLHRAARHIVERFGGIVPADRAALLATPGIGPYTVGAILSVGFGLPAAIVDGNVARVLSRVFALPDDVRSPAGRARLWDIAERLLPETGAGDYNQALMELGATLCTPRRPVCSACPLRAVCQAAAHGDPEAWPRNAPRRRLVSETHAAAVLIHDGGALLGLRGQGGRYAGLWEFPTVVCAEGEGTADAAARAASRLVGVNGAPSEPIASVRHVVTHHAIRLVAHEVRIGAEQPEPLGYERLAWASLAGAPRYPMSSPQTKLFGLIVSRRSAG